jgi:SH3-like domain-containing protein
MEPPFCCTVAPCRSSLAVSSRTQRLEASTKRAGSKLGNGILSAIVFALLALLGGCSRFKTKPPEQYVYVTARQTYLRDRVAAVSNRTGTVENGQRLTIIEHGRRFLRVRADGGETGWIDEKTVATQQTFDAFAALAQEHTSDPTVASAVVRDEVYLHLNPGRSTERFYRLAEGDKLSLLKRATLPRGGGPNPNAKPALARNPRQAAIPGAATGLPATPPKPQTAAAPSVPATKPAAKAAANATTPTPEEPPAPPPMEDWWLVRDAHGHTGWLLSRLMDVDAPDSVARYSEGQRIVGAYVLTKVDDPDAPQDDKSIPIYVTVLSPYKAGLPYDFDQVRVFTWNVKKHRYETAFREKNIEGYLPVEIKMVQDTGGKAANASTPLPGFTYRVLPADAAPVIPDPETGAIVPGPTIAKTYRLEGNILHRILPPGTSPPDELHPEIVPDKKDKKKAKKR